MQLLTIIIHIHKNNVYKNTFKGQTFASLKQEFLPTFKMKLNSHSILK